MPKHITINENVNTKDVVNFYPIIVISPIFTFHISKCIWSKLTSQNNRIHSIFDNLQNNFWLLFGSNWNEREFNSNQTMAINTNSSGSKAAPSTSTSDEGAAAMADSTNDLIELSMLRKRLDTTTTTPILKRKTGGSSKKLQFTTPEFSVTPIATIPGINTRLMPSRKR